MYRWDCHKTNLKIMGMYHEIIINFLFFNQYLHNLYIHIYYTLLIFLLRDQLSVLDICMHFCNLYLLSICIVSSIVFHIHFSSILPIVKHQQIFISVNIRRVNDWFISFRNSNWKYSGFFDDEDSLFSNSFLA